MVKGRGETFCTCSLWFKESGVHLWSQREGSYTYNFLTDSKRKIRALKAQIDIDIRKRKLGAKPRERCCVLCSGAVRSRNFTRS
ncbi:hypothetical protein VNO80_11359 [Phaseolus coccineus]|uniref:Uncharacterized protein n=1 Tax=Phaseolus coccineus TaxID=3886 RepID=A0AAN9NF25_PHACN